MSTIADCLRDHCFSALFIELLGWDRASGSTTLTVDGHSLSCNTLAHKRGLQVFWCATDRLVLMNRALLRKLQRLLARTAHEHILIFTSEEPRKQVWVWAIRLPDGFKVRNREHPFFSANPPAGLLDRLSQLCFSLDEEDEATLIDALDRVRRVLDITPELNLFAKRPWYAKRSDELARAMRRGDVDAFHRFIVLHRPLARSVSKCLGRWFGLPEDDAEQIGILGLIEAARRFQPARGIQFSTYATLWIKQACRRYGPDVSFLIRVPNHAFWMCFRHAIDLTRLRLGGGPSSVRDRLHDLELLNPALADRWRAYVRATTVVSLSDREQPEYRSARQIRGPNLGPLERVNREEMAALVRATLDRMHERDAEILRLRYGLDGDDQTLEQIGQSMGLTRERVRQIQSRAEAKLRELLEAETRSRLFTPRLSSPPLRTCPEFYPEFYPDFFLIDS
jgi:RNA polymerase primary sigma factor